MYVCTCVVLIMAGLFLGYDDSDNITSPYSYSFDPNYGVSEGVEHTCSYFEPIDRVSCGELNTLNDLVKQYRTAKSISRASDASDKEIWQMVDKLGLISDLKSEKIRYRAARHWKVGPLAQSVGLTLGIGTLCYFFTLIIYKAILYIAYGHTRVRKTPVRNTRISPLVPCAGVRALLELSHPARLPCLSRGRCKECLT